MFEDKEKLKKHIEFTVDITIKELDSKFQNLLEKNIRIDAQFVMKSIIKVFNHDLAKMQKGIYLFWKS